MRDIAIIGGGLVGLCAALALRHPVRNLTVIEAADLGKAQSGGLAARSIALSASSVQIFRALGIWPSIEACAAPIRHIHVSARERWGVTRLDAADYELDALGYVIENNDLTRILLAAVAAADNVDLEDRADFDSISQSKSGVNLEYRGEDGIKQIEAAIALIADGARSQARDALGIGHRVVDYGQAVVISNVEVGKPQVATAYERFTSQGPLAMLPLGGKTYACVWTMEQKSAVATGELGDDGFRAALQDCFGFRLGLIERVGQRFSVPIHRIQAEALQQGRCLLVGNAANALHPVAGQSFNLALRDVACLYELLVDQDVAKIDAESVGAICTEYESRRKREQNRVIGYGDGLVTLFSNELPLFAQARAAGLGLLDLLPSLKAQAALAGMGMTFGGNRLLRGHL
ncbi:MAG: FAD-dependent oxidoreductase [Gammaproteobacteria bacterium]|nr:MAG: FAD-dependent oxidoreductase [Gammaproteobacteria bacterium]